MKDYNDILEKLRASGNLRSLPDIVHRGKWIEKEGQTMLNLSSNDYLGLSSRQDLRDEFIEQPLRTRSRPAVQQRLPCQYRNTSRLDG